MAIPSRQIGWGTEDNLLWQISKQLEQLTNVTAKTCLNNAPTYKVYTALLTQTGGDDPNILSNSDLTIGVTYEIKTGSSGSYDFTNVGAPNNDIGTYFVATGTTPNDWASAFLNYNTGAPVVTVLENTIGNIWFIYSNTGTYAMESNGLFVVNKTTGIIGSASEGVSNGAFSSIVNSGINAFGINTAVIISGVPTPFDDELQLTLVEIRVYN